MLHVVATMYYNNLDFIMSNDLATSNSINESFEAALIVVNALVLGFAVALTIKAVVEDKFKAFTIGVTAQTVARLVLLIQPTLASNRESFVQRLQTLRTTAPPLVKGTRVQHPQHGLGTIKDIVDDDVRGRPVHVKFDNDEAHHYNWDSASQKLETIIDRNGASDDMVTLAEFVQAMQSSVRNRIVAMYPAVSEALFYILKAVDVGTTKAFASDPGISMAVVTSASAVSYRQSLPDRCIPVRSRNAA